MSEGHPEPCENQEPRGQRPRGLVPEQGGLK